MYMIRTLFLLISLTFIIYCSEDNIVNKEDTFGQSFAYIPMTKDIVMYEVNIRAMSVSGDFQGVISRLDHVKSLGVNVIWLMPIHPIGAIKSINSPYSVQNYQEVNPEFGTLDDLKELVEEAHDRKIAVIMDWVANHTAWDNPWIENSSWYTHDNNGDITIPPGTNWQDVADLNYENADMRLAMIRAMKYWIVDANIDGLRCDAADYVPFDFWQQAIDTLENIEGRKLIYLAEGARSDHFNAGFQMNYSWDFYNRLKNVFIDGYSAGALITTHTFEYAVIAEGKHRLRFTTNHDESAWDATPMVLFGGLQGSFAAFVITACMGGVPLVYGSQEVGVSNNIPFFSNAPIDWSLNPALLASYQDLLAFYNSSAALHQQTLQNFSDSDIAAFTKSADQEEILIMVNTRSRQKSYQLPSVLQGTHWIDAFDNSEITLDTILEFEPFQYYVLKNNS